jgi:DNA-binding protein H-NS
MKLDQVEFYEIKLAALLRENTQVQTELVQAQETISRLLAENCALKKQTLNVKSKEQEQQFAVLVEGLKKYGEKLTLDDIDWLTGEIKASAPGTEPEHPGPAGVSTAS